MISRAIPLSFVALALVACGGSTSPDSANGAPGTRLSTSALTDPAQCPAGGVAINAGIDANVNGVLDAAEIDEVYVVCNGSEGVAGPAYAFGDGLIFDVATTTVSVSSTWVDSAARAAAVDAAGEIGAALSLLGGTCLDGDVLKWDVTAGAWRCAVDQDTSSWAALSGKPDLSVYALSSGLAAVATSGSYLDLANRPDLSAYARTSDLAAYARSSDLAPVAASGSYGDLAGAPWATSGSSIHATHVVGATAVDQDSALIYNGYAALTDGWQSFTAGRTGPLAAVQVWALPPDGTTLTLYLGVGTSGSVLATATTFVDRGTNHWEAALPDVALLAGTPYTVRLTAATNVIWYVGSYSFSGTSSVYGAAAAFGLTTFMRDAQTVIDGTGRVGLGTDAPTAPLDVAGDRLRVRTPRTPPSGSSCNRGEWSWDASYLYVCVATNTWRRAGLADY
jgi:hypothetical protein